MQGTHPSLLPTKSRLSDAASAMFGDGDLDTTITIFGPLSFAKRFQVTLSSQYDSGSAIVRQHASLSHWHPIWRSCKVEGLHEYQACKPKDSVAELFGRLGTKRHKARFSDKLNELFTIHSGWRVWANNPISGM